MTIRRIPGAWLPACLLVALVSCQPEPSPSAATPVPSASAKAVVDSKVAKAVSLATQGQGPDGNAGKNTGGPPPSGVFPPGKADAELAPGAQAMLTLGSSGDGTKWKLGPAALASDQKVELELEVAHTTGTRQALPTLIYTLALKATQPKAPASAGGGGAASAAERPSGQHVVAEISKVALSQNQPGAIPPELQKVVQGVKGSKFFYDVLPDGAIGGLGFELTKGANASLDGVLRPAFEAFTNFITSFPTEPVGVGAFWMVKSRETYEHVRVIAYRMFKLEEAQGPVLKLSINVKRYAADPVTELPDVPNHTLLQFGGNASGGMAMLPQQAFPVEAALTDTSQMALSIQGSEQPVLVRSQGSIGLRQPKALEKLAAPTPPQ